MSKPKLWVTWGHTESGDDLQPIVWSHSPTREEIDAAYREQNPEEFEYVGHVYHSTTKAIVKP